MIYIYIYIYIFLGQKLKTKLFEVQGALQINITNLVTFVTIINASRNIYFFHFFFVILPSLGERPSWLLFLYTSIAIAINS